MVYFNVKGLRIRKKKQGYPAGVWVGLVCEKDVNESNFIKIEISRFLIRKNLEVDQLFP